ncbi:MAG: hypothetical protein A2201_13180 [Alicyclobacillus sp. RIFOXYA1_FULL_53_8]|nr:MAG: hypothetical protein A2201_13180 [Alicyclobacillus sp. RIFOXYA1_FULL_53_8]
MARVVIVAPEDLPVPAHRGGSVQIYVSGLMRALQNYPNHQLTLLSPGHRYRKTFAIVHVNGAKRVYQQSVLRQLQRLSPDVIQVENRPELIPSIKQSFPSAKLILNLHSNTFLARRYLSPAQALAALQAADAVVVNSRYLKSWIIRRFGLTANSWQPVIVYPGIELSQFLRPHPKTVARPASAAKPLRVLFVGRVIRQKGALVLIDAIQSLVRQHVPVKLTLVGRTPPWEHSYGVEIRRHIKNQPFIHWVGFVKPQRLPSYYWNSDVFVCPSQWREAFGLVNVEAMAAGLPVIASDLGGIKEVVDSSSGVLVKNYRDAQAFASVIRQLAEDPARRQSLQAGAERRARHFNWEVAARQFAKLYDTLHK